MKKDKAVQRLKSSFKEFVDDNQKEGRIAGKKFAKNEATFYELNAMKTYFHTLLRGKELFDFVHDEGIEMEFAFPNYVFTKYIDGDPCDFIWNRVVEGEWRGGLDDYFVLGFIEGALSYFEKIHDEIIGNAA